jgi:class 3 adenylate cyclase/predicted ATPase
MVNNRQFSTRHVATVARRLPPATGGIDALRCEKEVGLHPTGKVLPREPLGDVAVESDSALPSPAVGPPEPGSASDLTINLTPGPPAGPATKTDAPTPPAAFGRYQVRSDVGAGGFGAVYLGHDTQLDRPVAIKVLRGGPVASQARAKQFLQEARRLAQLSHPGIVAVHDVGLDGGQAYIVSDFLDGPDLGRWLGDNRPAWPEAARIAAALADALAHAHARLIVHRDVKPANIILTAERGPVLVDFGLGLDEAGAGGSELGVISGTPFYMAPEQVAGTAHRIDGRTDIYSLGVVLYEMLCGHLPFRASNTRELLRQVSDDEPQPPRQLRPEIPSELERACLKSLAKRLQDRYTNASDFAADLRRCVPPPEGQASSQWLGPRSAVVPPGPTPASASVASQHSSALNSSSRRARDAERRQVTVLVCGCGLFESEEYLEDLDAEAEAALMRAFQQACEQAVRQSDGTIVQCSEAGLLACFGYPVAYEDAAPRAARTGLVILQDLNALGEQLRREQELELDPWVGIHTGPAVVGVGEESVSVVGEARNVAIRLKDFGEPGQIVCSTATHRLIQAQFNCTNLGYRKIKGVAQPVELFRVLGIGEARSPVEAAPPAGLTPLTGRDHEINLLKDRWEQAQEGMGQVVLLVGEPGLGKSRVVHTLKQHVLGQLVEGEVDAPVIEWRCSPHHENSGLYPAIDFYERALAFGREEAPSARFDRLLRRLEQYELDRPETVPLWAALLSLPTTKRFPPPSLPPARQREETFRAMFEWLHTRAARRPVLFVVEDLHWADASTLEFLGQFLAEGQNDSILTLLTFRPEFKTPWPAVGHQTSLALNRLTRRQVGELMRAKTGAALPESVVERVYDRAGGVPLFVEEFTKMLQESVVLDQAGPGDSGSKAWLGREIPATLQDLVLARLDRVEGERDIAQLAATLGREFSYELLTAVASVDDPTLQAELAKLVQAEILYAKGRIPNCTYIFKHALLEDALYNTLVKGKRQQFHGRIAETLEARFPQTTAMQPELVAHHLTEAGLAEAAIGYWLKAGLRSRQRSAENEAIGHLTRGLTLLGALDESPGRDARELELLTALGTAYIASRGYGAPEIGPVFGRARVLCERIGQSPQLVAILVGIWEWHFVRGEMRLCMELVAEAMELVRPLNDPGGMMEVSYIAGQTMLYRGDFAGARDCFAAALAEFDDRDRIGSWAAMTSHNAGVNIRCNLAVALWHLGYPDQALKANREAGQLARELGHPFSLAYCLHHTAWLYQFCRLEVEVQKTAEEQIAISAEQGFALWHATGTFFKGAGMLLQGRFQESLPLLIKGHDDFRTTGAEILRPFQESALGEAYIQAARFEEAHAALAEGLCLSERNDDRVQDAELHRIKGELMLAESPDHAAAAEASFTRAIETARRQQSKAWELRSTMSLARLWQRQGRRVEAYHTLATIHATFTEGRTTPDLVEAGALLEVLA